MTYRPGGVIALAIIFIIIAALGVVGAIAIWAKAIPDDNQSLNFCILISLQLMNLGINPIAALGGATNIYSSITQRIAYMNALGVIIPISSILCLITAVGLLQMKKWGYYLALIIGVLMIIGGIIGLFFIVGILPLIFGIVVVVYLAGDVKYEFQ